MTGIAIQATRCPFKCDNNTSQAISPKSRWAHFNVKLHFYVQELVIMFYLVFQEEVGAFSLDLKPAIEATKMSECNLCFSYFSWNLLHKLPSITLPIDHLSKIATSYRFLDDGLTVIEQDMCRVVLYHKCLITLILARLTFTLPDLSTISAIVVWSDNYQCFRI